MMEKRAGSGWKKALAADAAVAAAPAVEPRIVVVSNRLPITVHRSSRGLESRRSAGGLVSALEPVLRKRGGIWVGWPGAEVSRGQLEALTASEPYEIRGVPLTETEVASYYHGFSNRTLWPLFHSFAGRAQFSRRDWEMYERVNERFAEAAIEAAAEAALVWIHDYHLMLAPQFVRQVLRGARLAFFLHIPFPPYDLFRLLPWDVDLLRGLLACDLVGFHVEGYARNFLDCAERLLGARVDWPAMLVEHGDRSVQVGAFPLGIDFEYYEAAARQAPRSPIQAERVVLGVDRLDYTKGIPERILAFERLLELHPQYRGKVVLLQLAVPSRFQVAEYRQLKREIDELVARVNGRFATASWSPIRYLYRFVPTERLAALYRDAEVALVTPLRDGMNLVAKEFVACQVAQPGVLILSKLAGAAETMHEAIQVNPYNIDATAQALHRALSMDEAERRSRLAALRRRERRYDVHWWLDGFLRAALGAPAGIQPPTDREFRTWLGAFLAGYHLALFLDYEGTLVPAAQEPVSLPRPVRKALEACAQRGDTDVSILSGRSLREIQALADHPAFTYTANQGLEIAGAGVPPFRHPDLSLYEERAGPLAAALGELCERGARVERKGATVTVDLSGVPRAERPRMAERAQVLITRAGFQARALPAGIEARPPIGWDKGQAVLYIARSRYGPTWSENVRLVYVGDDHTDEDAFRLLTGLGITFRVGSAETPTGARRRLPNIDAVRALVDWLARRPRASA